MKKYIKSHEFDSKLIYETIMGPSPLYFAEEICENLKLKKGMRVLDLGCGMGLSSMFIAKEYGVTVYACDWWIGATDNYKRFVKNGYDNIIPIHAEAQNLPFADNFFDAIICIDSFQYYGTKDNYFDNKLLPLLKIGGRIGFGFAGFTEEQKSVPEFLAKYWMDDGSETFHSLEWWNTLFTNNGNVRTIDTHYIEDGRGIWYEWAKIARERNNFDDDKVLDGDENKILGLMSLTFEKK